MTETASMEGKSDEDLFIDMAFTGTPADKVNADAAFTELHRRYAKKLYSRCFYMVKIRADAVDLASNMAAAALTRAYDRAEQYRPAEDGTSNPSHTLGYLCKIAKNLYLDYLDNPNRPGPLSNVVDLDVNAEQYSPEDFAVLYMGNNPGSHTREHYKLVAEAFDTLDDRTQIVLIETLLQRQRSPGRTYMLRKTATMLANRIGTSPENIRRIRKRGIDTIIAYVKKHKKNSQEADNEKK